MKHSELGMLFRAAGITSTFAIGGDPTNAARVLTWSGTALRVDGLSDEDAFKAQAVLDANPLRLDDARKAAASRVQMGYESRINQGVTPEGKTFSLRADEVGQQRVSRFLTLLREAEDLQPSDQARAQYRDTFVPFDAVGGQIITQSVTDWRADMVSFGLQVLDIETQLAAKLSMIDQMSNDESLQNVTWSS